MGTSADSFIKFCILALYVGVAIISVTHSDARKPMRLFEEPKASAILLIKDTRKEERVTRHIDNQLPYDSSNTNPYGVSSPFSLPPFDSLGPIPLTENNPTFCIDPPVTLSPPSPSPSTSTPTPVVYNQPPPSSSSVSIPPPPPPPFYNIPPILPIDNPPPSPPDYSETPNPPETGSIPPGYELSPPIYIPNPPETGSSPPDYGFSPPSYEPSPPSLEPSPPSYTGGGGGGGFVPTPVFQPPVIFPPPSVPPPPQRDQSLTLWCVAKPTVPDPIIEEAMNYACGSGADCASIQPSGSCYEPNTLFAHASYAFNSYWQRTKVAGGTCDFGGTAILVTVDPSFNGCHFMYN